MHPRSEDILTSRDGRRYILIRDNKSDSRRCYERICIACGKIDWLRKTRTNYCNKHQVRTMSEERRLKISKTLREKYKNPEYKKRILSSFRPARGPNHWNWKNGKTPINQVQRNSPEYKVWRDTVFARDNYTCYGCNVRGNKLHAHHIVPWSVDETLRFEVSNGATVCESCHDVIHNFMDKLGGDLLK